MRADPAQFEIQTPSNLSSALKLLRDGYRPFAGGTDLMVQFESGRLPPARFANINGLKELNGFRISKTGVNIGALCTFRDIADHPRIRSSFPALAEASRQVGAWVIQNRATLGGNLANASPAADSAPPLLAYGALLWILGSDKRERVIPYRSFHAGYKKTELSPCDLIRGVVLEETPKLDRGYKARHYFRKVGARRAQAISKVSFAGYAVFHQKKRVVLSIGLGLGAVGPVPVFPV